MHEEPRSYEQAAALLTGRCKNSKKLRYATWLERTSEKTIAVRQHATAIVIFHDNGTITLNTGGWRTRTTKDRLNDYTPLRIWQDKGVWYVKYNGNLWPEPGDERIRFYDGLKIDANGSVVDPVVETPRMRTMQKKLKKQIREYCDLIVSKFPLPQPSGGDCWYCHFTTQDGIMLGQHAKDSTHIVNHMRDGYVVPSLVAQAFKALGASDVMKYAAFGEHHGSKEDDWMVGCGKKQSKRMLYRFICRQFNLCI